MREIADDADIKSGILVKHFPTKEEILLEIVILAIVEVIKRFNERLPKSFRGDATPVLGEAEGKME